MKNLLFLLYLSSFYWLMDIAGRNKELLTAITLMLMVSLVLIYVERSGDNEDEI